MKNLSLCILFLIPLFCSAQEPDVKPKEEKVKAGFGVSVVQVQPEFPGGPDSLQSFLKKNLDYPDSAKYNRIQGRVYIGFLVDKKGRIKEEKVLSGVNELLNNEALRVVRMMPEWKPGTAGGNPVSVQYILPVDFILPKDITE
ncbi:MAG: energy transducer TonB [Bacteroidia bacterium]|nr:energy transducer TonB [Bacteroidia bacterium]